MFLFFLRTNLSEFLFKKVIYHLASEFPNPDHDNDLNAYRDLGSAPPSVSTKIRYPNLGSLDTVDAPLLHLRHPGATTAGNTTPPNGGGGQLPSTSEMAKLPV